MASGDLEYLEEVFLKVRRTKRWTRSFRIVRDAGHLAVSENSNSVVVGTNSSVSEPPGT